MTYTTTQTITRYFNISAVDEDGSPISPTSSETSRMKIAIANEKTMIFMYFPTMVLKIVPPNSKKPSGNAANRNRISTIAATARKMAARLKMNSA